MTIAFLFPGQGSQAAGMGKDWADAHAEARRTFEEADDALGFSLTTLCWEGPEDDLQLTANTQPALLTCSVAMERVLRRYGVVPTIAAGHSLGEYSALVSAGVLELGDALRLVRRRGELMQEAVPVGVGAMVAVIGLDAEGAAGLAAEAAGDDICTVANLNSPQQFVLAGHSTAIDRVIELAPGAGAKMAKRLPVSAPFHCPLMRPAREGLEPALAAADFSDPAIPVVTNIDAAPVTTGDAARDALVRQVDGPVRWVESMQAVLETGVTALVEVGAGRVLTGLGRRIERRAGWTSLPSPGEVEVWAEKIIGQEGEA